MNIVIVGHVDHGKSTIIGRLLADTGSLPHGKLDQVRSYCENNSKPFEYAFLLDALRDERAQGITIDSARVFFKTALRSYVITDAPGHVEFLKNMVTGASRADAALLVIDGHEGVQANSRRHAYLLSMLGIRQLVVLVNKMDLLDHSEERFEQVVAEFGAYLSKIGAEPSLYIPIAGHTGENLATRAPKMPWYKGPTLLEALDRFDEAQPLSHVPFRMPVQDVYKFTGQGDTRRIIAGTVESGSAMPGDELVFYPSGKRSRIASIEAFPKTAGGSLSPGDSRGFTLQEQIYVSRGELAARATEPPPRIGTRVRTSLFWLGKRPLHAGKDYILKLGAARTPARLERVLKVLDASKLESRADAETIERHEVGECIFRLARPIAFDLDQLTPATTRFVLVDDFEISGGGIVREELAVETGAGRSARFNQSALAIVWVDTDPEMLGHLERTLAAQGRMAYRLPADHGPLPVAAWRKLAEQASLLLDAGLIVLIGVSEIGTEERELLRSALPDGRCKFLDPAHADGDESTLFQSALDWSSSDGKP